MQYSFQQHMKSVKIVASEKSLVNIVHEIQREKSFTFYTYCFL